MSILVVGGGGREAALSWKLQQDTGGTIYCAPGNVGMSIDVSSVPIAPTDVEALLSFAHEKRIDLTVVGPEAPLVAGITDRFRAHGLAICGVTETAAQMEASKVAFKEVISKHGVPTAPYAVFDNPADAYQYIKDRGVENIVIKDDGLKGGKGVFLPNSLEQAKATLFVEMQEGEPGELVLIEDRLSGTERSIIGVTTGRDVIRLPFTQDYKRVGDEDRGPNTGGMGAHTLELSDGNEYALEKVLQSVLEAFLKEGIEYSGFIYLGVIMTEDGPMVLECNVRLGDPETQPILASIDGDFATLCKGAAVGNLPSEVGVRRERHSVCVVLASREYPESSDRNDVIYGLMAADAIGAHVFHSGTGLRGNKITTNGAGRILNVVGSDPDFRRAREIAYHAVDEIYYPGMKYRRDIGAAYVG